uniref:Uncharacterized protein n=1 Tax=uncultured marine microorganism HF4000_APKG8C21 TaxID=455553 RepID=B3TA27_9ZZZZ|nr:hypothetical protein ALOHA_HF4000APKG8C21ctg1g24 [uncultured marine microorganism HF4000_APKG8C21]
MARFRTRIDGEPVLCRHPDDWKTPRLWRYGVATTPARGPLIGASQALTWARLSEIAVGCQWMSPQVRRGADTYSSEGGVGHPELARRTHPFRMFGTASRSRRPMTAPQASLADQA